jgi:hypothetical protein
MPALRRFLAALFPRCFGSTQTNSRYEPYDTPNTPNRLSSGKVLGSSKATIGSFGGMSSSNKSKGITKTVETSVQDRTEDDEIQLVEMGRERARWGRID